MTKLSVDHVLGNEDEVSANDTHTRACKVATLFPKSLHTIITRVSNDRRPGRLVDHESVVDFEILVGRLLNDGQQGGPAGFGTGNGTLTDKNYDLLS